MIIVNSPSNPRSGAVFARAELERIFHLAKERGVWIMTNECSHHFLYGNGEPFSMAAFRTRKRRSSWRDRYRKLTRLTGWRMGFALARPSAGS